MLKKETRKFILLIITFMTFLGCDSNQLEGVYLYQGVNSNIISPVGSDFICSRIGKFEFKNGKCKFVLGTKESANYDIDNDCIYLESNPLRNSRIVLKIIDDNTISYMDCNFVKEHSTKD